MNKVTRDEVRTRNDYEAVREAFRAAVMTQKDDRRVHLGEYFTFLFENHDTVLYQIQEMIRAEGIDAEPEILHEIETYNELLGEKGELGFTLLIEIDDPEKRPALLAGWTDLPETFYLEAQDGRRISPEFDPRQVGENRISSVQYMKFRVGDGIPRRIGCSHPSVDASVELTKRQVAALCYDLMT